MGGGAQELQGPDFGAGITLSDLEQGRPLLGHHMGESVVLVRSGERVDAVGAVCTHYSAPLAEGLVTGDTIRCPWHHACFSLRTGEAVAAPALNPIPRWRTEVRAGRVYVVERETPPAREPAFDVSSAPSSVVIVGAGAAGSAAAETLRREGYAGAVTMIDPDPAAPYDRPNLSKDYLAGNAPEEWLPLRSADFYREQRIDRVVATVTAIDPRERRITLSDGRTLAYGALLLATGASPIRLPIPGSDQPHVHVLRSLNDCRSLIAAVAADKKVVIAGASFIAMEAAASLRARGALVTIVAPEAVPFGRILGEELGVALRALHEQHGVEFRLGRTLQEIRESTVLLSDGAQVEANVVLLGVGVRPVVSLAEQAGIEVDNGILVDARLKSSVAGVFAAGDIARFIDPRTGERARVEHWVVAQRQGQAAARSMLGQQREFSSIPFFWTQQYDVAIAYVGYAPGWDEVEIDGSITDRDCAIRYLRNNQVAALATIGRDRESLNMEVHMELEAKGVAAC